MQIECGIMERRLSRLERFTQVRRREVDMLKISSHNYILKILTIRYGHCRLNADYGTQIFKIKRIYADKAIDVLVITYLFRVLS